MDATFRERVYELMATVPYGKVTTYGDLAALAGHPAAARVVGQIAHFGPEDLPWHRLVNKTGKMANGFWGGVEVHATLLRSEGVIVRDNRIEAMDRIRWTPDL